MNPKKKPGGELTLALSLVRALSSLAIAALLALPLRAAAFEPKPYNWIECGALLAADRPVIYVVDPYSSGGYLGAVFEHLGVEAHAVFSTKQLLDNFKKGANTRGFQTVRYFQEDDGDFVHLAAEARRRGVTGVIAGSEPGVLFAHRLAVATGTPHNDPAMAEAWRNKFLMHETLRLWTLHHPDEPIAYARQRASSSLDDLLEWQRTENEGRFPVYMKPLDSSGTNGVHQCNSVADMRAAYDDLYGSETTAGTTIETILAMEYLPGTEYVVDAVLWEGEIIFSDFWRYVKNPITRPDNTTFPFYDYDELLAFEGPLQDQLKSYARRVLRAFGVSYGPVHMEIIMTPDRGPVLVESGNRIIGAGSPLAGQGSVGISQVELTALAYAFPKQFLHRLRTGPPLQRKKFAWVVEMPSYERGVIEEMPHWAAFLQRPGVYPGLQQMMVKPGDRVKIAADLGSSTGRLTIVHEDESVVQDAHRWLRDTKDFFRVRPFTIEEEAEERAKDDEKKLKKKRKQRLEAVAGS